MTKYSEIEHELYLNDLYSPGTFTKEEILKEFGNIAEHNLLLRYFSSRRMGKLIRLRDKTNFELTRLNRKKRIIG